MRALLIASLLLLASPVASNGPDTIKLPVEVDQQGKTIYFVTDATSDVMAEAGTFCGAHLPNAPLAECVEKLVEQVATVRKLRHDATLSLPGITFTVNKANGVAVKFVHEEGANPADEAREFCQLHFPGADEGKCVEAMLQNAAKALDEVNARYSKEASKKEL